MHPGKYDNVQMMIAFETIVHINEPTNVVNQAYTDPENLIHWTKDQEKLAPLHTFISKRRAAPTSWKMYYWKQSQAKDINPVLPEEE